MKKIFTLSLSALLTVAVMGQYAVDRNSETIGVAKQTDKKYYVVDGKISEEMAPRPTNKALADRTDYIDYFDVEYVGYGFSDDNQVPRFYTTFQDSTNTHVGTAFTHLFDFTNYELYGFDSLKDEGTTHIDIDTILFNFGHKNHSGQMNTLAVTIKTVPTAGPLTAGSILWSDTATSMDFTPGTAINVLPLWSYPVGITLPYVDRGFYVEIYFDGAPNDTGSFLFNYWDSGLNCATTSQTGSVESFTYRIGNLSTGRTYRISPYTSDRFGNPPNTYYSNFGTYYDCNGNSTFDRNTNEAYVVQNVSMGAWFTADRLTGISDYNQDLEKVSQNQPNPFNDVTTIEYTVKNTTNVTVDIFDITGKSVMSLNEGQKVPGTYKVSIDGSSIQSGIYYYAFKTNAGVVSKKMIIQH